MPESRVGNDFVRGVVFIDFGDVLSSREVMHKGCVRIDDLLSVKK